MTYTVKPSTIPDVLILEPKVISDERGFFFESYNQQNFVRIIGKEINFVQDNHSRSVKRVLRGLHYQIKHPQGKIVRVTKGEVFDVAVDLRKSSPHFGEWIGCFLSANNKRQLWIPPGFAHGFLVTSKTAEFSYKTTAYWYPEYERCLLWNDPTVGIEWPTDGVPFLAPQDEEGKCLPEAEIFD